MCETSPLNTYLCCLAHNGEPSCNACRLRRVPLLLSARCCWDGGGALHAVWPGCMRRPHRACRDSLARVGAAERRAARHRGCVFKEACLALISQRGAANFDKESIRSTLHCVDCTSTAGPQDQSATSRLLSEQPEHALT